MLRRNKFSALFDSDCIEFDKAKKNRRTNPAVFNFEMRNDLDFLDCLEHLECGLVGADKKTLEVFTQTLALQCVATRALFLSSHVDLFSVIANSESLEL